MTEIHCQYCQEEIYLASYPEVMGAGGGPVWLAGSGQWDFICPGNFNNYHVPPPLSPTDIWALVELEEDLR